MSPTLETEPAEIRSTALTEFKTRAQKALFPQRGTAGTRSETEERDDEDSETEERDDP